MNKKVTLFNQVTGPLFIDIANAFSDKYNEVILVTGTIEHTYARLNKNIKVINFVKYRRHKTFLRIITWFLFSFQSFLYLLFKKNIGKVFFVTNPPMLPLLGCWFSRRLNYDILVYDVYPEALSNFGYISTRSFISKVWNKMNKKTYKSAERIFTISRGMKKIISKTASADKIEVIYPWVNSSFIKPKLKSENWFVKKYNLFNKKVVLYSGNMGKTHDLITVLKAAKELNKKNNDFYFLFIGDGVQKKELINYSKINNLSNVLFLPFQKPEVLPFSFASADFGIVSLGSGAESLSVPSKTYYMLAAGSIIIGISETNSELSRIVSKHGCGKIFKPGDYKEISTFLEKTSKKGLTKMADNSRKASLCFSQQNVKFFLKKHNN